MLHRSPSKLSFVRATLHGKYASHSGRTLAHAQLAQWPSYYFQTSYYIYIIYIRVCWSRGAGLEPNWSRRVPIVSMICRRRGNFRNGRYLRDKTVAGLEIRTRFCRGCIIVHRIWSWGLGFWWWCVFGNDRMMRVGEGRSVRKRCSESFANGVPGCFLFVCLLKSLYAVVICISILKDNNEIAPQYESNCMFVRIEIAQFTRECIK